MTNSNESLLQNFNRRIPFSTMSSYAMSSPQSSRGFLWSLTRKKIINSSTLSETKLARCLTTLDLTALGIGSTLGVGVYVLAGEISKEVAGPAVVVSFFIAAVASVFAGLCYAEFGSRVPKAGSAYIYSYVCVGEFIAFIIGWNLILEYVIGSASVVKAFSNYFDTIIGNPISTYLREHVPMNAPFLADYPDFFAFGVTLIFSTALAFGAKESSMFNNVFTVINLSIVIFVVVAGAFKADVHNWNLSESEVNEGCATEGGCGKGGFAPYGIIGIIKGAAVCFYGFIGFDCVATAGEEARNPQKSIPISVVTSLFIVFLAYFGVSTVLTMMLPYYLQDPEAPLPHVFDVIDWPAAKYAVSVGALAGLCSSLLGAMFPLPRIIYAMSNDGLLFHFMGKIHPKFQTPLIGTLSAGLLTGLMAMIFDLSQLIKMMSIGTLLAYSMVAACVLILRYEEGKSDKKDDDYTLVTFKNLCCQIFNPKLKNPTSLSSTLVTIEVALFVLWCFGFTGCIVGGMDEIKRSEPWIITLMCIFGFLILLTLISIQLQPKSNVKLSFSVPLVPWLPAISILINVYLMLMLDEPTWKRFGYWIIIGLIIYFAYGRTHSVERYASLDPVKIKKENESIKTGIENKAYEGFKEDELSNF